jgi:DNA-binding MarR family transcriptional regulator
VDSRGAFWLLLLRVASETRRAADRAFASSGSSCDQVQALLALQDQQLTVSDLAHDLGLERNSASQLVERLVQRGLTSRERSDVDRRQVILMLTPLGQRALDDALDGLASLSTLVDDVPHQELAMTEAILAALNARVGMLGERAQRLGA